MRKQPTWVWASAIFGGAVLVLLIINVIAVVRKPNDEKQIRTAIEDMRQASLQGKPGGFLQYLSDSFELPEGVNIGTFSNPKAEVAKFLRKATVKRLEIKSVTIDRSGDTAVAHCYVSVDLTYLSFSLSHDFPDLQIDFKREVKKRLFVIPDPTWLVVKFEPVDIGEINL